MTLTEKKALVSGFLGRCNEYADRQLARYRAELEHASADRALELADKIVHWSAYRAFNDYAIGELGTDALDEWLEGHGGQR